MSTSTLGLPDALARYVLENMVREPEGFAELRKEAETLSKGEQNMRMSPEQGSLIAMLIRISGARRWATSFLTSVTEGENRRLKPTISSGLSSLAL